MRWARGWSESPKAALVTALVTLKYSSQKLMQHQAVFEGSNLICYCVKNHACVSDVSLSSDFISGFCGETEDDHQQTLSLIREVGYNAGFLFAYSMRKKTHAFHRLQDDVAPQVKQRRLEECISVFRAEAERVNAAAIGSMQLVLVEGESKRSADDLCGRTDGNMKVIFPKEDVAVQASASNTVPVCAGDYVLVK
ncbi:CDK5 regulatory subunit associated protein 1, partial [Ameca splendens]